MVMQVRHLQGLTDWNDPYLLIVFFSTMTIYSVYRLIGFTDFEKGLHNRRIDTILKFKSHILLYVLVSGLGVLLTLPYLSWQLFWILIPPVVLAGLYIMPLFHSTRRVRELPFIKVFIVGVVWAWVCVYIPLLDMEVAITRTEILLLVEKLLFIIAITIPFDIRDQTIDQNQKIKTIPGFWGTRISKEISTSLIAIALLCVLMNWQWGLYSRTDFFALLISYLATVILIYKISENSNEYWYSGALDGTILLQLILMLAMS